MLLFFMHFLRLLNYHVKNQTLKISLLVLGYYFERIYKNYYIKNSEY